jgi:hypothetical protein
MAPVPIASLPPLLTTRFPFLRLLDLSTPHLTAPAFRVTACRARVALQIILAATLHTLATRLALGGLEDSLQSFCMLLARSVG